MTSIRISFIASSLVTCSSMLLAAQMPVQAEVLVIALGNFKPQFSDKNEPALFKDIIDSTYSHIPNQQIEYRYNLSNARLIQSLNQKAVDGAANIFASNEVQGCITAPVFRFSDVAISKKENNLTINSVSDLRGKSIVTYQRAKKLLGQQFNQAIETNENYNEVPHPDQQAKLLASGLVDVSIGDKYIFLQSLGSLQNTKIGNIDPNNFVFHEIFPPVYSSMGFNEQAHCDAFNIALKKLKQTKEYEAIYNRYLNKLGYRSAK